MSSSDARVRRVSGRQLEMLLEFLNSHRDVAVAYNRSLQAKEYSTRKWREISENLNSQGEGAHKDWRGWSKYWVDYKAKLKKRAIALRSSQLRTGGGPSTEQRLTEIEMRFLQILGEDLGQGIPGVQVEPIVQPSESAAASVEESPASHLILHPPHPIQEVLHEDPPQDIPLQHPESPNRTPTISPRIQPAASAAALRSPRRRRRRPLMTQEAARRALVQSSQQRADAAVRSTQALEGIERGINSIQNTLNKIESDGTDHKRICILITLNILGVIACAFTTIILVLWALQFIFPEPNISPLLIEFLQQKNIYRIRISMYNWNKLEEFFSRGYGSAYQEPLVNSAANNSDLIRDILNVSVLTISVCAFIVAAFAFFVKIQ